MSSEIVKNGLTFALVGAGIGGMIGVIKSMIPSNSDQQQASEDSDFQKYEYLKMDSVVLEALGRFKSYKHLCPHEYKTILDNLNELIRIQVDINNGKISTAYAYQSTSIAEKIRVALARAKLKARNVSVTNFDADENLINNIANDYVYNISRDIDQYILSRKN
jgi:hypothetical protein